MQAGNDERTPPSPAPAPARHDATPAEPVLDSGPAASDAARLEALFWWSTDCIELTDLDGHIRAANRASLDLTGSRDVEAVRGRLCTVGWEDDGAALADAMADARAGGIARFRGTVLDATGAPRWLDVTVSPVRDRDGTVVELLKVARDITMLRAAERDRRASESRLAGIVASAMDAIVTVDAHERIVLVNRAAEHVFGWRARDLIGEPLEVLIPERFRAAHHGHIERFGRQGASTRAMGRPRAMHGTTELAGRRRDGSEFPVEASISQVETDGEHYFTVILRDVTERRDAERARQQAIDALRESEERTRILFRDGPLPTWVYDNESFRILDVNEAAVRRYGWTRDEFRSLTILDLRPARAIAQLERAAGITDPGVVAVGQYTHLTKDGHCFEVEVARQRTVFEGRAATIVVAMDVSARVEAEGALRASEERYALATRATSDIVWDRDLATGRVTVHGHGLAALGVTAAEVEGDGAAWRARLEPSDRARVLASIEDVKHGRWTGNEWTAEYRLRRPDGTWARLVERSWIQRDAEGRAVRMTGAVKDVTVERELAERLRQAQKMEAVRQLAGGVAHDFNNLLTVIGGNLAMALEDLRAGADPRELLEEIALATRQATGLVRQLLTFSRRAESNPARVALGGVVRGAERLLHRVIGEEITLDVHAAEHGCHVFADAGQLEQVLMNLVVNARDAMLTPLHGTAGHGGTLTIEVDCIPFPAVAAGEWPSAPPPTVARLRVRDTGHGMDDETRRHVFEPFFTTKEIGKGTGIGLATVFGIVTRAGGVVRIDSAPGAGTTVDVLLPIADPDAGAATAMAAPGARHAGGTGATVLLVEDEGAVRAAARRMLERRGHRVLEARHGADALVIWRTHGAHVDIVVTDVRMPEMGGVELVAHLRAAGATVPVVYVSGYADQGVDPSPRFAERLVPKPFDSESLGSAVEAALAAR